MEPLYVHIPPEMFSPAESDHFEGEYQPGVMSAGPDLYTFPDPLMWQIDVTNTGGAFLVEGTVEGMARTSCARCLEDMEIPITGEIEGYYLVAPDGIAPDELEGDEFEVLPETHDIDMIPLLDAALKLEFPVLPLCRDDCQGICPNCGADLNQGPCQCAAQEEMDEPVSASNPFAALKDYKFGEN